MQSSDGTLTRPDGSQLAPAGAQWDAIRTTRFLGLAAVERLGTSTGDAIVDPGARRLYLLVPVGTAATWDLDDTRALGHGSYVTLPPRTRTGPPGPYWLAPPGRRWRLSHPAALRQALTYRAPAARTGTTYITPECRLGQCGHCHGNTEIRRVGAPAWEAPVERLRCGCGCGHPGQAGSCL